MPLVNSPYNPALYLHSGHLQTIGPALFRRISPIAYQRKQIETPDGDVLDLDWSTIGARRLCIVSHGLEGSSRSKYLQGMVRQLNRNGWDVLAWNFRGCGGTANRFVHSYHSGSSPDLATVISHALAGQRYDRLTLVGFSVGGNITLKYLGEAGSGTPPELSRAVTLSVPVDLKSSALTLARRSNRIYMKYFLNSLLQKIREKDRLFPGQLDLTDLESIKTFLDFDSRFIAPLHQFRDAYHYWQEASSRPWLHSIRIPTAIINAANDPFLGADSFPVQEAAENPMLHLEIPRFGGHVGFFEPRHDGMFWSERRILALLEE